MPPRLEDDTIVVKDEAPEPRRWSRPSTPTSMSAGPDGLEAAHVSSPRRRIQSPKALDHDKNLIDKDDARNHNYHHRPSPAPLLPSTHGDREQDTTPDTRPSARSTPNPNKRPRPNVMTTEERLLAMPEKRAMPWRPGVDPGADIETGGESRRKQIRFGCLLATRGDVVPIPCVSCANGRGKFSVCVADPSLFRGACAGCQLSGRPNRCSIKQSDDAPSPNSTTPDSTSRNVKKKLAKAHSPLLSKPSDQRPADDAPAWHNSSPQWPQEYAYPHPHPHPQANPNPTPTQSSQRWATVNPPPQPIQPPPSATTVRNGLPLPIPTSPNPPPLPSRSPMGWATVNAPPPLRSAHPTSIPPPSYLEANGAASFPHRERREDTHGAESIPGVAGSGAGGGALIDTLPKNKQRQVYGVLSGLQSGIEQLQRELDGLKRVLGVEEEG